MQHASSASSSHQVSSVSLFMVYRRDNMPIAKHVIRILMGWGRMSVQDFYLFGMSVYQMMTSNSSAFPNPPIDLETLKTELDRFESLIAEASHRDSRVYVAQDQLRHDINNMLRRLAQHVEDICIIENDRGKVALSGFVELPSSPSSKPLRDLRITRVEHGKTGELCPRYTSLGRAARHYLVRKAPKGTPHPDSWPVDLFANAKDGALFENLTPGVVYTFQVRAFLADGSFTDWSPSVDKMCT
jgi:hypothetical protein